MEKAQRGTHAHKTTVRIEVFLCCTVQAEEELADTSQTSCMKRLCDPKKACRQLQSLSEIALEQTSWDLAFQIDHVISRADTKNPCVLKRS